MNFEFFIKDCSTFYERFYYLKKSFLFVLFPILWSFFSDNDKTTI